MPLRTLSKARKAVFLTHKEEVRIGNCEFIKFLGSSRCLNGVTVVTPSKVKEVFVTELGIVRGACKDNTLKIASRFHRALERLAPEVALKCLWLFLFGEDKYVLFALFNLIKRACTVRVRLSHKRNADIFVFAVGTSGDCRSVRCPGPGSAVLGKIADVLRHSAPAVAIIAYCGDHGKVGLADKYHLHTHIVCRSVGVAVPSPCAVLNYLKSIGCALYCENTRVGVTVNCDNVPTFCLDNLCHFFVLQKNLSYNSIIYEQ